MVIQENDYRFQFTIKEVQDKPDQTIEEKIVLVDTVITYKDGRCLYDGQLRVKCNAFGIYPFPADIAKAASNPSLRQTISYQLKRFIRPAKPFL
ncbi:diaminopimelate epimerase [Falsibacillus pallidus]|uniref:diaminopimelate epimerase n=1 Tax=Falsibacillus pallidus TaxID=493781 RepID=UPI003D99F20F